MLRSTRIELRSAVATLASAALHAGILAALVVLRPAEGPAAAIPVQLATDADLALPPRAPGPLVAPGSVTAGAPPGGVGGGGRRWAGRSGGPGPGAGGGIGRAGGGRGGARRGVGGGGPGPAAVGPGAAAPPGAVAGPAIPPAASGLAVASGDRPIAFAGEAPGSPVGPRIASRPGAARGAVGPGPGGGHGIGPMGDGDGGDGEGDGDGAPGLGDGPGDEGWGRVLRGEIARRIQSRIDRERYPAEARDKNWQGVARVAFTVRTDGSVSNVRVVHSSGHVVLDRCALRAVWGAAPFPAPPAPREVVVPVRFILLG